MNPIAMTLLLTLGFGSFAVSIVRRWRLLFRGATRHTATLDNWSRRWSRVIRDGFLQTRLRRYKWAGWAHTFVFFGFIVLLARTLILWGRGYSPEFQFWILGAKPLLNCSVGEYYNVAKDISVGFVLLAVTYFVVRRIWFKPARLRLSAEGLVILALIAALMVADEVYDGASLLLANAWDRNCVQSQTIDCIDLRGITAGVAWHLRQIEWRVWPDPLGSLVALALRDVGATNLALLAKVGFWSHSALVLVFLNWLPYSKHFHVITAVPNLLLASTGPAGKLETIANSAEALLESADRLQSGQVPGTTPIGITRVDDLTWKDRLDLFSCTECGRCTEHCPAFRTGKPLSPMHLTLDLRNELFKESHRELIPQVVNPETVWSCTTCRACEEQCHTRQYCRFRRRHLFLQTIQLHRGQ